MVKNITLSVLSIFAFAACSDPEPLAEVNRNVLRSELDTFYFGDQLVHVEKITKADFKKITSQKQTKFKEESYYLMQDSSRVRKNGDTLFFKTESKTVTLINNTSMEGDDYVEYSYKGHLKDLGQFLVYGQFYEWTNYFLVDDVTGDTTLIYSPPLLSPDGKTFVTWNADFFAAMSYNGFSIFKNTHRPQKVGERVLGYWAPDKMKWIDNFNLAVECTVGDTTKADQSRTDYFKLNFDRK